MPYPYDAMFPSSGMNTMAGFGMPGAGAGAMGLGGLGMSAGLSFLLPMILGQFMKHNDPTAMARDSALRELSPQSMLGAQNQFYSGNISSPAFGQQQRMAIQSGSALKNFMQHNAAAAGLQHAGVAGAFQGLANSSTGNRLGSTYANAWNQAGQQAQYQQQARANAYMGTIPQNYSANLAAGGMNAFLPLLYSFLSQRKF